MKVTISVAANHLKNVAGVAKGVSDPFAVLTALPLTPQDGTPLIIGKTEVIKNTLDPDWTATFNLDFELGKPEGSEETSVGFDSIDSKSFRLETQSSYLKDFVASTY